MINLHLVSVLHGVLDLSLQLLIVVIATTGLKVNKQAKLIVESQ